MFEYPVTVELISFIQMMCWITSFYRLSVSFFFFFFLSIYLLDRERETVRKRGHKQGEWQAEGAAGSPLSREPSVGLNPRSQGS